MTRTFVWPNLEFLRRLFWLYLFVWIGTGGVTLGSIALWFAPAITLVVIQEIIVVLLLYGFWQRRGRPSLPSMMEAALIRLGAIVVGFALRLECGFAELHGRFRDHSDTASNHRFHEFSD